MTEAIVADQPDRPFVPGYRRWIPGWRMIGAIVLLIVALPLGVRWSRLWWLPAVPEPFDVEAFCESPMRGENAYDLFRKAVFQHVRIPNEAEFFELQGQRGASITWNETPESIRKWVDSEQAVMDLFRQGGRCADASFLSPRHYTITTMLPVQQEMRDLFRLAYFDVLRRLDEGNTREAAEVLHDSFRVSRHLGRRGCAIERLIGVACHAHLMPMWQQWSRHPQVTAEELEAALARLREDWQGTSPLSDQLKVDYLTIMNETKMPMAMFRDELSDSVERTAIKRLGLSAGALLGPLDRSVPYWQVPVLWTIGEPELSIRAVRLFTTHELKTCDLPLDQQMAQSSDAITTPELRERTAGLTADQIDQRVRSTFVIDLFGPMHSIRRAIRNEAARQVLLEAELRLQIDFRRERVASRSDAERLASRFEWPVDPCSAEGQPIRFRFAEEGLVIWSLSWDSVDQGGVVSAGVNRDQDLVVVIPWPGEGVVKDGVEE